MHHRTTRTLCLAWLIAFAGCASDTHDDTPPEPTPIVGPLGANFDAKSTGTISGAAIWQGDIPKAEEHLTRRLAFNPEMHTYPMRWSTPHVPKVDVKSNGIENAVVFLRHVDLSLSKPWDHAPARIEIDDRQLVIAQGKQLSGVGFVRPGESVEMVNIDTKYHNLKAGGAAFFGIPMYTQNAPHRRTFTQPGVVDLRCAAGYYWLHAHLFVVEHPYYVRTDSSGRFELNQVPPGDYELVCWLPSWHTERAERCPETGIVIRYAWKPPVEQTQRIRVHANQSANVDFRWENSHFAK